jgi:CHAD domain-containing protein
MLEGERYANFKSDFRSWINERAWEQAPVEKKQRKHLQMGLVSFARKALDDQAHRVMEAGSHVNRENAKEMHRLRIECKKLRYTSEFFKPVFLGMDEFITHMKGLQDLLGVMNDVSVMQHLLALLLREEHDPEAPQYAGGLVGWRTREFQELLSGFDARWEELVEAKRPWWKKSAVIQ